LSHASTRPYIVGNWKMNGLRDSLAQARAIARTAQRHSAVEVGLAPPFTLLHAVVDAVGDDIAVGGQDCHTLAQGAYTGDISAPMLVDAGASFVLVGHSERRECHGETSALVQAKAQAALGAGLEVIICVGESQAQRDAGAAAQVVREQVLGSVPPVGQQVSRITLAYEPIWAIGSGRVPTCDEVRAMHALIRACLVETYGADGAPLRILYGGSVTPANAAQLLAVEQVGGALVGGASLAAESFGAIIHAAAMLVEA
jgi:triosephosphate isomerase